MADEAGNSIILDLNSFNDVAAYITKENEKLSRGFVDSLKADLGCVRAELKNDIDAMANNLEINLEKFDSEQSAQADRITRLEDTIARMQRISELVISGIPFVIGESCIEIVKNISKVISFHTTSDTVSAFRLKKTGVKHSSKTLRNAGNGDDNNVHPLIVVKFASTTDKSTFMGKYLTYKSLCLKDIGFQSDRRIFIKENLTPANYRVFRACSDAKRNESIAKLHTRDGICYIGRSSSDPMVAIHSIRQLSDFLGSSSGGNSSNTRNLRPKRKRDDSDNCQQSSDHRVKKGKNPRNHERT